MARASHGDEPTSMVKMVSRELAWILQAVW